MESLKGVHLYVKVPKGDHLQFLGLSWATEHVCFSSRVPTSTPRWPFVLLQNDPGKS